MTLASDLAAALDPAILFERAFGMAPLDWQRDYLRETRPAVVLKGRQVGASSAAAALAISVVRYEPDVNAVVVSPSMKQSVEITTKARLGLRNLGVELVQDATSVLRLRNGSRIISLPGSPRSVRGWSARLLLIDEAAFVGSETWSAARALVATGGRLVAQSTPADGSGDFYELVTGDDPGWARFIVPSDGVPTISPEFLDGERRAMSPDAFAAEFECTFLPVAPGVTRLFSAESIARVFEEVPA